MTSDRDREMARARAEGYATAVREITAWLRTDSKTRCLNPLTTADFIEREFIPRSAAAEKTSEECEECNGYGFSSLSDDPDTEYMCEACNGTRPSTSHRHEGGGVQD